MMTSSTIGTCGVSSSSSPVGPDGSADLRDEDIEVLSDIATRALTSMDKQERDSCAEQLLFLSSYDYWDVTKGLLPRCTNNYLRFMVCKAIHFIVSNELGPHERELMRSSVLMYLQECRTSKVPLSKFVRNELYSIYASALYSNWKVAIISSDKAESGESSQDMAVRIVSELNSYLEPEEVLDCLQEVVNYFARQNTKVVIYSVRSNFAKYVLPHIFNVAASYLSTLTAQAATLCCMVLESIPDSGMPRYPARVVSDPTVYVLSWPSWWEVLPNIIDYCGSAILQDLYYESATTFGALLRACSTVMSPEPEYVSSHEELAEKVVLLSESLLNAYGHARSLTGLLRLACALLVNVFERNKATVIEYLRSRPAVIAAWAEVTETTISRFADDEDELRQALMHLFYLIGDSLLPPRHVSVDPLGMGVRSYPMRPGSSRGSCEHVVDILGLSPLTSSTTSAAVAAVSLAESSGTAAMALTGQMNSKEDAQIVEGHVMSVFMKYLTGVMDKAHLREDSNEIRTEAGVVLHNERTLLPLAEMLFCDKADFVTPLVGKLQAAIYQYGVCVRARQGAAEGSDGPLFSATGDGEMEELLLTLQRDNWELAHNVSKSEIPLLLIHLSLSQLSVIVSIFAITMVNGTARRDDVVFQLIATFARDLLTEDDTLTDSLLQCLAVSDAPDTAGGDGGGNTRFHLGILRALFFFCGCVYESEFSRQPEFYEISLNLLRYVYLYHSDVPCLMVDANVLLHRTVANGISGTNFIGSDTLMTLIRAVNEDRIAALHFSADTASAPLAPEALEARRGFLTAFVAFVETRYYAGYATTDVVQTLVLRTLSPERLRSDPAQALADIDAITRGCRQPDTLDTILEGIMHSRACLLEVVRSATGCAPTMTRWFATLSSLAKRMMLDSPLMVTPWEMASLMLNSMCLHFSYLSYPTSANASIMRGDSGSSPPSARFFRFPVDVVDPSMVHDLADIVLSVCAGTWCNIGVMLHYERATVEHFFCGAIELLLSVSVQMLMSTESGRIRVFNALLALLEVGGATFNQLHTLFMRQELWERLLRHLSKCLSYSFAPELLKLINIIVFNDKTRRCEVPEYSTISASAIMGAFYEVALLIVVAPHLEIREMKDCFNILEICYQLAPAHCTDVLSRLLDYCSAYHRVRLRMILTLLSSNRPEMLESYMSIFGQSSKVAVLAAW